MGLGRGKGVHQGIVLTAIRASGQGFIKDRHAMVAALNGVSSYGFLTHCSIASLIDNSMQHSVVRSKNKMKLFYIHDYSVGKELSLELYIYVRAYT